MTDIHKVGFYDNVVLAMLKVKLYIVINKVYQDLYVESMQNEI